VFAALGKRLRTLRRGTRTSPSPQNSSLGNSGLETGNTSRSGLCQEYGPDVNDRSNGAIYNSPKEVSTAGQCRVVKTSLFWKGFPLMD
jgi:hypothetical protein